MATERPDVPVLYVDVDESQHVTQSFGLMLTGQQDVLDILTVPMLWFVVFFIPGFVLVAAMFAARGVKLVMRKRPFVLPSGYRPCEIFCD